MMPLPSMPRRAELSVDRATLAAALGFLALAATVFLLGPARLSLALFVGIGVFAIAARPDWGVTIIVILLLVQYGQRGIERTGQAGLIASLVPPGEGLLTPNNILGLYLASILAFQIYRDGDLSFLRSRQVQLVLAITVVLIGSGILNGVNYDEQAELGLRITGQSPMRALASRALFLVLFVAFVRRPSSFRSLMLVFVALSLFTSFSGSSAALGQGSDVPQAAAYRAGGTSTLIETAGNPNRLAMVATLALVMIWEFTQSELPAGLRWTGAVAALGLIVTVFLTASRGGVVCLFGTGGLLLMQRGHLGRRVIYALLVAVVAGYAISQVVPEAAMERLSTIPGISSNPTGEGEGSIERREYTYVVAYNIWKLSPIIGVGLGNWQYMRFLTDPTRSAGVAHNSYLEAVSEGGLITLGLYLLLFLVTHRQLRELAHRPEILERIREDRMEWVLNALRVSILSFMAFSLSSDLWDLIFFYFLMGLAGALINKYNPPVVREAMA